MASPKDYPVHAKLKAVQHHSQAIHEFVLWLQEKHKIFLASYLKDDEGDPVEAYVKFEGFEDKINIAAPDGKNITNLVAEYFEIDQNELENEKRRMLQEFREHTEAQLKKELEKKV